MLGRSRAQRDLEERLEMAERRLDAVEQDQRHHAEEIAIVKLVHRLCDQIANGERVRHAEIDSQRRLVQSIERLVATVAGR